MKILLIIQSCIIIPLLCTCSSNTYSVPDVSFYYWRTEFNLKDTEKNAINEYAVKKLYVRYFDIGIGADSVPYPIGKIKFSSKIPDVEIVPVVYIKNEVMLNKRLDVRAISDNILQLINAINTNNTIDCSEIQIDCDWSLDSRDKFMIFIDTLKVGWGKKLSATIRLHQIKFADVTQIPDVDYGTLMYYNMGKINAEPGNSIYDKDIADLYNYTIPNFRLPINVALPIFAWGVHVRNDRVIGLINKIVDEDLNNEDKLSYIGGNFYLVKENFLWKDKYLRRGDKIKYEKVNSKDLKLMAKDLSKLVKGGVNEIIFYDLDSLNLEHYEEGFLREIINNL